MKRPSRDTGESGETYEAEMLSEAFDKTDFHNPLPDNSKRGDQPNNVPDQMSELRTDVPGKVCNEQILLENMLRGGEAKTRSPYGSPYHRTQHARNYRKDLTTK